MRIVLGRPSAARRRGLLPFLSLLVAALAAGCVDQAELPRADATSELPIFEGAADYARVRLQLAAVDPCPGGAVALATFTAADEVFGLPVALAAGATLTVAAQGDPSLDTILGVYGPDDGTGFYGRLPIAVDDDSGDGWLSRLTATVEEAGAYFVVVTTAGGLGRGPVTLAIGAAPCGAEGCADDGACDDGDDCTIDRCDAATGACVHTRDPACGGGCRADSACDDGNVCTIDRCDEATGSCTVLPQPEGMPCDDGDPSTTADVCTAGVCRGAVVTGCAADSACDDGNGCTIDRCDEVTGTCTILPVAEGTVCDDGDPRTTADVCAAGVCRGTAVIDCDDGDACTIDALDPATGVCVHTPDPTCASGCTADSACDDGNVCTIDRCDAPTGSCTSLPVADGTACDDGDPRTAGDVCAFGGCRGAAVVDCDDGNECTTDVLDPATGACVHFPIPLCGAACAMDWECDDQNPCTTDRCDRVAPQCVNQPLADGAACDDADPNTTGDVCTAGLCHGAPAPGCTTDAQCDAGDPCAVGSCDPASAQCRVAIVPDGTPCDDGRPDTAGDACVNGVCVGAGLACDDANACTTDSYDPATGTCVHVLAPDGTPCSDGDPCTWADVCHAGVCLGTPRDCDDQDPCTEDRCDATTGVCWNRVICLVSRLQIGAPVEGAHISAGVDPTTGGRASEATVTFRFAVTQVIATDKIRLRLDDQAPVSIAATTLTYNWARVTCGSHLLSARLTNASGVPYAGSEDIVRFHVSCLCDSDLECAIDDPCRAWICLGGTGGAAAFGSCRYGINPEDENCCLTTADCRNVTLFTPSGADWQCVDVDGDQAGDCVECVVDGDCDDGDACTQDWCKAPGECVFSPVPACP
jgi:hypothetical protein